MGFFSSSEEESMHAGFDNSKVEGWLSKSVGLVCPLCGRTVANRRNLKRHVEGHICPKRFKCDICLKSYSRKEYITEHKLVVHNIGLSNKKKSGSITKIELM